jgi:hypothetical protein
LFFCLSFRTVKPIHTRATAKPNKTNRKSRDKTNPDLPAIVRQKRTMEETHNGANSMEKASGKPPQRPSYVRGMAAGALPSPEGTQPDLGAQAAHSAAPSPKRRQKRNKSVQKAHGNHPAKPTPPTT